KELTEVDPTDIVVLYFLRDAEDLAPDSGNFALRTSELAVTLWIAYHRLFDRSGEASLVDHYRATYRPDAPAFLRIKDNRRTLPAGPGRIPQQEGEVAGPRDLPTSPPHQLLSGHDAGHP